MERKRNWLSLIVNLTCCFLLLLLLLLLNGDVSEVSGCSSLNRNTRGGGCYRGYCWAYCGEINGGSWCYTSARDSWGTNSNDELSSYYGRGPYIPCTQDWDCNSFYVCGGACE